MATVLTYTRPHDLSQLHDELLAAVPALRPVPGPDGVPEAVVAVMGEGDAITLVVPDGTDEGAVGAVVAAHAPRVRYDPATRLREVDALRRPARRAALLVRAAGATTLAELRDALVAHLREGEG